MAAHVEQELLSDEFIRSLKDNVNTNEKLSILKAQLIELEKEIKIKEDTERINQLKIGDIISSIYIYNEYDNEKIGFFETEVTVKLGCRSCRMRDGTPKCNEILMPNEHDDFFDWFNHKDNTKAEREYGKEMVAPEWLKYTKWMETFTQIKNEFNKRIDYEKYEWLFAGDHHDPEWESFMNIPVYVYYRFITIGDLDPTVIYKIYDAGGGQFYIRYTENNDVKKLRECDKKGFIEELTEEEIEELGEHYLEEDYIKNGWLNNIVVMKTYPLEVGVKKQRTD
jgi:hypothetical protein